MCLIPLGSVNPKWRLKNTPSVKGTSWFGGLFITIRHHWWSIFLMTTLRKVPGLFGGKTPTAGLPSSLAGWPHCVPSLGEGVCIYCLFLLTLCLSVFFLYKIYQCAWKLNERGGREENCCLVKVSSDLKTAVLSSPSSYLHPPSFLSLYHTQDGLILLVTWHTHTRTHTPSVPSLPVNHKCRSGVQRSAAAVLLLEKVVTWGWLWGGSEG